MPQNIEMPGLLRYLDAGVSPFHVVEASVKMLQDQGFLELDERRSWRLETGRAYFVRRNHCTLFAFRTPSRWSEESSLRLVCAHTDSPALRLKPNPSVFRDGLHLLNVEVYGSPLLHTWLDRDLGYAGLLVYRPRGETALKTRLVRADSLLRIPSLAVHLDREVNSNGLKLNAQQHLMPILGMGGGDSLFQYLLESHLQSGEELVDFDLQLFDAQPAALGGLDKEFILSGRLDNLAMCHASLRALLDVAGSLDHLQGVFLFHNEEVGSSSYQGAESDFARSSLQRLSLAFKLGGEPLLAMLARSFCISADMAHAVHPAFEDKHDSGHRPKLNGGPVLKVNAARRYATEALGSAAFREMARLSGVSPQVFVSRNDMPCGSTVGPGLSARLGMPVVDVGNPMLSMHSIREMAGSQDHEPMIQIFKNLYQADLCI